MANGVNHIHILKKWRFIYESKQLAALPVF